MQFFKNIVALLLIFSQIILAETTSYSKGVQEFKLINPPESRNIQGNYIIAGNTIECITNQETDAQGYDNGICQNSESYNNNNYLSKYIDIDNDSLTWNSSSSNFTLPENQAGILWAGLFWQGAINNIYLSNSNNTQHRAYLDEAGQVQYKSITESSISDVDFESPTDLTVKNANKILFKLDGDSSYTSVNASTFYYDIPAGYSRYSGYYAAFSNVTNLLQSYNLAKGLHKVTIANITANEGKEMSIGNIGGWSLVVIFRQQGSDAKSYNISIYNGYTIISESIQSQVAKIAGFKLPTEGIVSSSFSAFAGEGEEIYSPDSMVISRYSDLHDPQQMPGAANTNNIFDAKVANIARDSTNNNAVTNTNGIDIDTYDTSDIMTNFRDQNPDIDTIYIGLTSTKDYITPSMMAFATELYTPKLCYDAYVQHNKVNISTKDRNINTLGDGELSINVAIRSFVSDFDLKTAKLKFDLSTKNDIEFDNVKYAPNTVNILIPAHETNNSNPPKQPEIGIGEGVTGDPTEGGVIRNNVRYFSQFNYNIKSDQFNGSFNIELNASIDFGSGATDYLLNTNDGSIKQCPQSLKYQPQWARFNIERIDNKDATTDNEKYPLYTQIVGRDFDFSVLSYEDNKSTSYEKPLELNDYTVDVELIDAQTYDDNNSFFRCGDPNPNIIQNVNGGVKHFVLFKDQARVDVDDTDDLITNTALRSAAFRIWLLVDGNNTIIPHTCTDENDGTCFKDIYKEYIESNDTQHHCTSQCSGSSKCYECLRTYFATPICSRDNFAIRPAAYSISVSDSNESNETELSTYQENYLGDNSQEETVASLAAGYQYKFDANATRYNSNENVLGYRQFFFDPKSKDLISRFNFDTTTGTNCADTSDKHFGTRFENGSLSGTADENQIVNLASNNRYAVNNVGIYRYHIEDMNWTLVDQDRYEDKDGNKLKTFKGVDDCLIDDNNRFKISTNGNEMSGCGISSKIRYEGNAYYDLKLRYEPYKFDIDDINYTLPHTYDNKVFINQDLETPTYNHMAAIFEGDIYALGKDGTRLSNYTYNCAAKDVVYGTEQNITKDGEEQNASGIVAADLVTELYLRRNYIDSAGTAHIRNYNDSNASITVSASEFTQENNASAKIKVLYNFSRLDNTPVNPLIVQFTQQEVNASTASSHADLLDNYIPKKILTMSDKNATFIYMRIAPSATDYEVKASDNSLVIPFYTEVFCDVSTDCASLAIDGNDSILGTDGYIQYDVNTTAEDGPLDKLKDIPHDKINFTNANTPPTTDDAFHNPNPTLIQASIKSGTTRPYDANISADSSYPYYDNANPHVDYKGGGGGWAGTGKTGLIVDTNASFGTQGKRVDW